MCSRRDIRHETRHAGKIGAKYFIPHCVMEPGIFNAGSGLYSYSALSRCAGDFELVFKAFVFITCFCYLFLQLLSGRRAVAIGWWFGCVGGGSYPAVIFELVSGTLALGRGRMWIFYEYE